MTGKSNPSIKVVLSDDYLQEIGRVVAQWAYFECDFKRALHYLRQNPAAKILCPTLPFRFEKLNRRFQESVDAMPAECEGIKTRLHDLSRRAGTLSDDRNELAHGKWLMQHDDVCGVFELKAFNVGEWNAKVLPLDNISALAAAISTLHGELDAVFTVDFPYNSNFIFANEELSALRIFRAKFVQPLPKPIP